MKLFESSLIEMIIVILTLIGALLLSLSNAIESLHLNDKGWSKPRFVCTLESTGLWFVGIAGITIISYAFIYAILNI
jgi:hypothetical protein